VGGDLPFAAPATNDSNAQEVYFAKSFRRRKITAYVGPARCGAAFPKLPLIRCCSIPEILQKKFKGLKIGHGN
jgi:hypothetical protein